MTKAEAIDTLVANYPDSCYELLKEAVDMAIEALKEPERKKGNWINDKGLYRCSACNELWVKWWAAYCPPSRMYKEMKYCPNCGARMVD